MEHNEVFESDQIETYFNRETLGVLTDPIEISYYKTIQYEQIVENRLLGEFDNDGNYFIEKEILQELINAKKYIKEAKENRYVLEMLTKENFESLFFTLQIDTEGEWKVAVLRLIEANIRKGFEKELLKTNVAKYKDDNDAYFMAKLKKVFNIVDDEDGREIDNQEVLLLILKKLARFEVLNEQFEDIEVLAKEYIEKIVNFLENHPGKCSDYILRHYYELIKELGELSLEPDHYRKLRAKFDLLIDETIKNSEDIELESFINRTRQDYVEKIGMMQRRAFEEPFIVASVPKEKKKEESIAKKEFSSSKKEGSASKKISTKKKPKAKKAQKNKSDKKKNAPALIKSIGINIPQSEKEYRYKNVDLEEDTSTYSIIQKTLNEKNKDTVNIYLKTSSGRANSPGIKKVNDKKEKDRQDFIL